jgi:Rieske Fe-S protein
MFIWNRQRPSFVRSILPLYYLSLLSVGAMNGCFEQENRRRSVMIEHLPTDDKIIETAAEKDHPEQSVEQTSSDLAPDLVGQSSANERPSLVEQWDADKQQPMSRRQLLSLIGTGGGAVAATALLAACSMGGDSSTASGSSSSSSSTAATSAPATQAPQGAATSASTSHSGTVLAQSADVPANSAKTFPIAGQQNPGVLIHLPNNSFVAYDTTCTHQQCEVKYNAQSHMLECPCHAAVFDPAKGAAVVSGPAPTPLTSIKVMVNSDGTITKA